MNFDTRSTITEEVLNCNIHDSTARGTVCFQALIYMLWKKPQSESKGSLFDGFSQHPIDQNGINRINGINGINVQDKDLDSTLVLKCSSKISANYKLLETSLLLFLPTSH